MFPVQAADVFIYSFQSSIRGIDLTQGTDRLLTNSPFSLGVNALAYNLQSGIVYYGAGTSVYRWNPSMGSSASAHTLMNDFSVGPVTAPITNINSTAGSYLNGKYYVGSESTAGYIQDMYEVTMSNDGTQVVSVRALNLLAACNCTEVQLGGFGDVAAIAEGGSVYLYGSSADLSGQSLGTSAGRWKFGLQNGTFQLLSGGSGGQMSAGPDGALYSNVGNSVREVDKSTGAISGNSLFITSAPIYDFTGGFSLDYGDAPDSYGSAFHRLSQSTGVRIGALGPDNEAGSLNSVTGLNNGSGDDVDGIDDEDAVTGTVSVSALVSEFSLNVQCSTGARVAGWIDSNINGVFDNDERNFNHPVTCAGGQAELRWSGMLSAAAGNTSLRLRASANAAAVSQAVGIASDGEVEDHPVTITGATASSGSCPANATSLVFDAIDIPKVIGPNANTTSTSTITVSDNGTVVDVNVLALAGTHTYINDLFFDLSHAGTSRRLYGPSCGRQNNFSFSFDDSAGGTPPCPPIDGSTYPPVQSLSSFNGQDASGAWQLRITDRYNGDGGSLTNWQLELCVAGSTVAEVPDLVLGKHAVVDGQQVKLQFALRNTGNVQLTEVSIEDDLDGVFGVGNYSVLESPLIISGPASAGANAAFNGSTVTQLLASSVVLDVGEQLTVEVVVQVDVITGGTDPGLYLNQATGSALSPTGVTTNDLSGAGLDTNSDTDDPVSFQLDASARLEGFVFLDTAADTASAHDGVRNTTEAGVGGRLVQILDSNNNAVTSTTTDAAGYWQVSVAAMHLDQVLQVVVQDTTNTFFISEAAAFSTGPVTDGTLQLNATYADTVGDIDIGVVLNPLLQQDRNITVNPGLTVSHAHRLTASTHGVASFALDHNPVPTDTDWVATVWLDNNCNEELDSLDTVMTAPVSMVTDETLCLLSVQEVPLTTINGAVATTRLTAQFTVADESLTGHGVQLVIENTDTTNVVRAGSGRLELEKTVRNMSAGGMARSSNAATPGQILEYSIVYQNTGDGTLDELIVKDSTPPFTTIQPGAAVCNATPASLICSPAINGDSLIWTFSGTLASGESGQVSYRVVVD